MKIFIHTLGCKVNQYETQAMETLLAERGHTISPTGEDCDVCVVNTCAVTAESGRKSRQAIRRLRDINPNAVIAVCGCYSQISPEETASLGVDLIGGSANRRAFVEQLETAAARRQGAVELDEALRRRDFEPLPAGKMPGRTRAMLKIEDGCDNFCSYCIIPYARGPVRSLPPDAVIAEASRLDAEGFREIVVTGIEIASYGKDLKTGVGLGDIVADICAAAPNARIRLGSLEPRIITEDFCRTLASAGNVCPHFHLSLQSGCDETLRRMRRKYDTARFYESVLLLRDHFPDCALTADLIVGFPGETDEEFASTLAFIEKCAFSQMHIFPYSRRPGTAADRLEDQIDRREKQSRARRASEIAGKMKDGFLQGCVGTVQSVLFEQEKDGLFIGHAGNYCEVMIKGENLKNCMVNVQITGVKDGVLLGNAIL
ncbi:MAG: tRNA (N(6)-L-threonylcarbamoyladenosine(37)-C(2))-methylthiotransferase MtaB [Oscillospiraceae bacterium]|nr:tRNA (N(6)-L-threonylcarbamoyladenosine(37)-C(2))-methylthiotransferase MtaB [Oscillospiraceae bacterium]